MVNNTISFANYDYYLKKALLLLPPTRNQLDRHISPEAIRLYLGLIGFHFFFRSSISDSGYYQIQLTTLDIIIYQVAIFDKANRAPLPLLRVKHDLSLTSRCSRKPTIGNHHNTIRNPLADQRRRGREHFSHSRTAFGTLVSYD